MRTFTVLQIPTTFLRHFQRSRGLYLLVVASSTVSLRSATSAVSCSSKFKSRASLLFRAYCRPAEHTLQCYRAHPVFLAGQSPHRAKPHSQCRSRILKHRACGRRNLIAAACALNTARLQRPALAYITSRTMKPVWPPEIEQVLPAGLLGAEAPLELLKRPWIILFHDPEHFRLRLPESNGYPVQEIRPEMRACPKIKR